jgi:hypothetical protein
VASTVKVYPVEYVYPRYGWWDHNTISELNLLDVLGVYTVADAMEELHQRILDYNLKGLKQGMYLDLTDGLTPEGGSKIEWDASTQNLRIVIASFNQYEGRNWNDNHIKFVFKNCPVTKAMRSWQNNAGGYSGGSEYGGGEPSLRNYLESPFLKGLKTALGHDYFYRITRYVIEGNKDGWETVLLAAKIFIDTEMEVFGNNRYSQLTTESALFQTALYKIGGATWRKKQGIAPDGDDWWLATPYPLDSYSIARFCIVSDNGDQGRGHRAANHDITGVAPAFCIR